MNLSRWKLAALFIVFTNCAQAQKLDRTKVHEILAPVPSLLKQHYVNRTLATQYSDAISKIIQSGAYDKITNEDSLAKAVTRDLKIITKDGHVYVQVLKNETEEDTNWEVAEQKREQVTNYGFTKVEIMDMRVGYMKIVEFMNSKTAMPTAVAAMKMLETTDTLIIDLRGNGGGYPGVMEYIMNHYYEGEPILLSTTVFSDTALQPKTNYSSDLVYGKLRINTPLYILVNNRTASAAEYFTYTLQQAGKAVVVGEQTAGAAHMNDLYELPYKFRMSISTGMPVNAITKTNWELTGITPNVIVDEKMAEERALELINKAKH
ncbi:MAG: hypothetical protein EOP51_10470 [Sphingobacteriales bacterium]|nr:MAG: hypothetical protein EOP51_10470 [Sphingobacteriales bacterium]